MSLIQKFKNNTSSWYYIHHWNNPNEYHVDLVTLFEMALYKSEFFDPEPLTIPENECGYNLTGEYDTLQFSVDGKGGGYHLWIGYNHGEKTDDILNHHTPVISVTSDGRSYVVADSLLDFFDSAFTSTSLGHFNILEFERSVSVRLVRDYKPLLSSLSFQEAYDRRQESESELESNGCETPILYLSQEDMDEIESDDSGDLFLGDNDDL